MALEPAKLSDFKMAGALGAGATARVYDAVHAQTGRAVAIKLMDDSGQSSEMRERFAREALLLAGVDSRYVSKILGFGFERGQPFLVLERLVGETLDAKLRRDGPVPMATAGRWIEQLIVGVRDCHDAKVIHRDIKPSNIYIHHDGLDDGVKLIDFGVARLREVSEDSGGLTSTNHFIGSMGYMAPEQFHDAKSVGFTADLYAVGVVIFRTLTGRLPFVSRSLEAVIRMKSEQPTPVVSSMPGMAQNPHLDWFVQKAMARAPTARFQSGREMLDQWWTVMASVNDEDMTDVMRRAHVEAIRPPTAPPPTLPHSSSPAQQRPVPAHRYSVDQEDRTVRRVPRPALPSASARPGPLEDVREEAAPLTIPSHPPSAFAPRDPIPPGDPFELPTRVDPDLRKLVERERELQKERKERK